MIFHNYLSSKILSKKTEENMYLFKEKHGWRKLLYSQMITFDTSNFNI